MISSPLFWLFLTLIFIGIEAFFTMMEMAIVSFNKVRLQYYVNKNMTRANWILSMLKNPTRFFGTALLGINIAMVVGSECSRQMYAAWGFSADFAPLTQVLLVIIFAEIAPLFAARRYAEHVAMLGIPLLYALSIIMTPIIWLLTLIVKGVSRLFGGENLRYDLLLSREEVQRVLEEQDEGLPLAAGQKANVEFNVVVANIFNLRNKTAKQVMAPLPTVKMVPSPCTVGEMSAFLRKTSYSHLPIYHRYRQQIIALASPRDLLRAADNKRVRDYARPPWFITENSPLLAILKQFRHNHQDVAVVLNEKGEATGILTIDDILDEVFGELRAPSLLQTEAEPTESMAIIERTFPADMLLKDFNAQFHAHLEAEGAENLEELMSQRLGHNPQVGESVRIDPFELTVVETTLLGTVKSISIRTLT